LKKKSIADTEASNFTIKQLSVA